jgi:hypothetical protein
VSVSTNASYATPAPTGTDAECTMSDKLKKQYDVVLIGYTLQKQYDVMLIGYNFLG